MDLNRFYVLTNFDFVNLVKIFILLFPKRISKKHKRTQNIALLLNELAFDFQIRGVPFLLNF